MLATLLSRAGMAAFTASSVAEAERELAQNEIDLIVLDVMLPDESGLSFCKRLRLKRGICVIMLTALSGDIDRIVGLELGADDYLGKPFNPRELVARIKAVLRRSNQSAGAGDPASPSVFRFGPFRFVPDQMVLTKHDGDPIKLTSGEFALLRTLVESAPRALSRDTLMDLTGSDTANTFDRTIDSQISRIRRKIEQDPRQPIYIKTVRNLGYAFSSKVIREIG